MKTLPWLLPLLLLTGCARLDAIPYSPPQTAATWLTIQPYAAVKQKIQAGFGRNLGRSGGV